MPLFSRFTTTFSTYIWPWKKRAKSPSERRPLRSLSPNIDAESARARPEPTRKRSALSEFSGNIKKKAKVNSDGEDTAQGDSTRLSTRRTISPLRRNRADPNTDADREAMPPPSLRKNRKAYTFQIEYPKLPDLEDEENQPYSNQTRLRQSRAVSKPSSSEAEAHQRNIMSLPENSGIWAAAERDLFFRLALRGYEPLLPRNWMIDFPTYPITLFSRGENSPPPLLHSFSGHDFRATRALSELTEMGKRIRDRALVVNPTSSSSQPPPSRRSEPIMAATITAYFDWALSDAKMHPSQRPNALPVHIIATLAHNQSTHDAITAMTAQLHNLAAQHRARRGICASVEPRRADTPASSSSHPTEVLEDAVDDDDETNLPVLTGLLICSSLVVVVTLNAHAPTAAAAAADEDAETREDDDPASDLRFIATFDFSEAGMDVWNALAVAIVAVHVRNMMVRGLEAAVRRAEREGEGKEDVEGQGGEWEVCDTSIMQGEEEDPDA